MSYNTRSKYPVRGPQGDIKDEPTKENGINDNSLTLQSDQSNSSKEDRTNLTSPSETETITSKSSITNELGNINHNLDVFTRNFQEDANKFNEKTIFKMDMGMKMTSGNGSKNEYRIICKIGHGGFSIVWLVIDLKTKEFKVAKLFKYDYGVTQIELDTYQQTANHPNILRFYERLGSKSGGKLTRVAIFEPLGKDLNTLMKDASKHGGLSISVVKKVAKHILMALKSIHGHEVIHSDIKLHNIAPSVSQLSLRRQFEKIIESMKSGKNLSSLRMVCDMSEFDVNNEGKLLEKELEEVLKLELKEDKELIFKLIDFGNADKKGTIDSTGTYGFRPPEYFFGAPLLPSHDIWSLGVVIVVLLTNEMFLDLRKAYDEITALRSMFGKFPRRHFKGFKKFDLLKRNFLTRFYPTKKAKMLLKNFLQNKFNKLQMDENDRMDLIDFLLQMLNTIPNERKSAEELLSHPWLNSRRDEHQHEHKHNSKNSFKLLPSKHPKNGGEGTVRKKAAAKIYRFDSFIYKENDGEYYLYHKYWKCPYRGRNLFRCPKCKNTVRFKPEIGFVMVSDIDWHVRGCIVSYKPAVPKGHCERVNYKPENQKRSVYRIEVVVTNEEVDHKRKSLENQGYKPFQKEAEINEFADDLYYNYNTNSDLDETADSDLDETEEDSIKTISEFGSGESYFEEDTSDAPSMEIFSDDEFDYEIGKTSEEGV